MYGAFVLRQALCWIVLHLLTCFLTHEMPIVTVGNGPIIEVRIVSLKLSNRSKTKQPVSGRAFRLAVLTPKSLLRIRKLEDHSYRALGPNLNPIFLILLIITPRQAERGNESPVFVVRNDSGKSAGSFLSQPKM